MPFFCWFVVLGRVVRSRGSQVEMLRVVVRLDRKARKGFDLQRDSGS